MRKALLALTACLWAALAAAEADACSGSPGKFHFHPAAGYWQPGFVFAGTVTEIIGPPRSASAPGWPRNSASRSSTKSSTSRPRGKGALRGRRLQRHLARRGHGPRRRRGRRAGDDGRFTLKGHEGFRYCLRAFGSAGAPGEPHFSHPVKLPASGDARGLRLVVSPDARDAPCYDPTP